MSGSMATFYLPSAQHTLDGLNTEENIVANRPKHRHRSLLNRVRNNRRIKTDLTREGIVRYLIAIGQVERERPVSDEAG